MRVNRFACRTSTVIFSNKNALVYLYCFLDFYMINACTLKRSCDSNYSITAGLNLRCTLYHLTGAPEILIIVPVLCFVKKLALLLYEHNLYV